ncbi:cupin domain-containing protein [Candidatus Shapirobacteria bacterium]|nr:cupin domain-containing protein [Candidatus Shapirobacteria bacterium]
MTLVSWTNKQFSLKESINYQSGSVVSKEILKSSSGNITLFAFDKNQGLSEHQAPFNAFVLILEGKAEVTVEGVKNYLKEGEMILMPANKTHALKAPQKFKMLLIMIRSESQ